MGFQMEGSLVWTRRRIARISGDRNLNSGSVAVGEQRLNVFLRSFIALMKCNPSHSWLFVRVQRLPGLGPTLRLPARRRPGGPDPGTGSQSLSGQHGTRPRSPNPGPTTNPGPRNIIEHQPVGASHLCNGSTVTAGLLALSHLQGRVVPVLEGILIEHTSPC